jgi:ribosome maturation factor RimP
MTSRAETDVAQLVAPTLDAMGYDLVRVKMSQGVRPTLQIMAERRDGTGTTIDDCAKISRAISTVLDVEEPIARAYSLEVSSPGIDRPLIRLDDFARFSGHLARITTRSPIEGRKRFRGKLLGVAGDVVLITVNDYRMEVPFNNISSAKLELTHELVAMSGKRGAR